MHELFIKRIYDPPEERDGKRILVDRLWPRGIKKETAKLDAWFKELAPSHELRKWFHSQPGSYQEFKVKYLEELSKNPDIIQMMDEIGKLLERRNVTLLFSAKNTTENNAVVLKEAVQNRLDKTPLKE